MVRICIIPCAGYDRPGGHVTREVSKQLREKYKDIKIGSIAAVVAGRPGELKDVKSSKVICLDGCNMNCSSKIIESQGIKIVESVEVSKHSKGLESSEEKANAVSEVLGELITKLQKTERRTIERAPTTGGNDLVIQIDKFKLSVRRGFYYTDNDFWVSVNDQQVRVGATDLLQQMASDIYFVDLVEVGTSVELGDDAGMIESTKTAFEVIIPVSGKIIERNDRLLDSPELVNESPYDDGWFYVIEPSDMSELELLMTAEEYLDSASERARREIGKKATE